MPTSSSARGSAGRLQPAERWRYPARERVLVGVETAIHHGERGMLALPSLPFAGQFRVVELLGA